MMESHLSGIAGRLFADRKLPRIVTLALLLPPVLFLHPIPIDETSYLAVAWNMHWSGHRLVPQLDGTPYSDKAPLLFWLINLVWAVTGAHVWAVCLLELLIALATMPLLASLGRRLGLDRPAIETSQRLATWTSP